MIKVRNLPQICLASDPIKLMKRFPLTDKEREGISGSAALLGSASQTVTKTTSHGKKWRGPRWEKSRSTKEPPALSQKQAPECQRPRSLGVGTDTGLTAPLLSVPVSWSERPGVTNCRGLACWPSGEESACQRRRHGFDPWMGTIPWRRKWPPTPVFLPGKSRGQRSLVGHSPWGREGRTRLTTHADTE